MNDSKTSSWGHLVLIAFLGVLMVVCVFRVASCREHGHLHPHVDLSGKVHIPAKEGE